MAHMEDAKKSSAAKVVAVCSAKGGIGKTLLSVNLAVALNKNNLDVALMDADFQFGDVALALDLHPSFTIKDVIEELNQIDHTSIQDFLTEHATGVNILAAPEKPEYADLVTSEAVMKIIHLLKAQQDYLIVDNGIGIQEQSIDLLEQADKILLVTNLEMTALKNTKLMLETFRELGIRDKVSLVVNRYTMESLMEAKDVPEMLGEHHAFFIPNNFKLASQSLNLGLPFVLSQASSDLSKSIFKMAEGIASNTHASIETMKNKKSVLSHLLPFKGKGVNG
ncbi:AAA family ATPase [Aquibacillus albus]|uniref:Pilus assembly protein CpaE n=1 Tax=Aquibacillus albus TaxID=1168171 RepID=A0ABS2N384_9BACI|nr:P-loop NTPase [Aquibacillus albus]MBM7572608.1 pilus assembly protein CpaE [Aquibacillus albus]